MISVCSVLPMRGMACNSESFILFKWKQKTEINPKRTEVPLLIPYLLLHFSLQPSIFCSKEAFEGYSFPSEIPTVGKKLCYHGTSQLILTPAYQD